MESIEIVKRHHINSDVIQDITGCPIQGCIVTEALRNADVLQKWEIIAPLPAKYEAYSIELLEAVITLENSAIFYICHGVE